MLWRGRKVHEVYDHGVVEGGPFAHARRIWKIGTFDGEGHNI